jgi:hypothetical protein
MQVWVLLVVIIVLMYMYYADIETWLLYTENMVEFSQIVMMKCKFLESPPQPYSSCNEDIHEDIHEAAPELMVESTAPTEVVVPDTKEKLAHRMIIEGMQNTNSASQSVDSCADSICDDSLFRSIGDEPYAEWISDTSIDPLTRESHRQYVEDRMGDPQTQSLGTSRPLDQHDTYDAVPWQGLARPSRVPVDSPDQLADIDYSRFADKKRVNWSSDIYV